MKRMKWILFLAVSAANVAALEPAVSISSAEDWPYLRPEFRRLMEAVTFHLSFDRETLAPDMAEGAAPTPKPIGADDGNAGPRFSQGVVGRALVLGSGAAVYPRSGNVLLAKRGALALWVRPEGWQRPRDGNCVFAMTTNASFYLQRQGPDEDDQHRVRRHEGIQYLVFLPENRRAALMEYAPWENDRWYLLAANWAWPTLELSVNGEPFQVASLPTVPDESAFGDLVIGNRSPAARGLLDEVIAFRRPLSVEEIQLLTTLRPHDK